MTDAQILPYPSPLDQLASAIRTDLQRCEAGRQEWIEGTLSLADHLKQGRGRFPSDPDFGHWFDQQQFINPRTGNPVNGHDRAALIQMGANLELAREILEVSDRFSWRHVWEEEMQIQFGHVAKLDLEETSPDTQPLSRPTLIDNPELVEKIKTVRAQSPGITQKDVAAAVGTSQGTVARIIRKAAGLPARGNSSRPILNPRRAGSPRRTAVATKPEPVMSEASLRAARLVLDYGKTQDQAARETGVPRLDVRMALAFERGQRAAANQPAKILTDVERKEAETAAIREEVARAAAEKEHRIAARQQRKSTLKSCVVPDRQFHMFGQQMWPIPAGSHARYSYDQLLFSSLYFHGTWDLLRHHHRPAALAITMRTYLKHLYMFVDRRLAPGDDKSEMTGFIQVFEILCDASGRNPEGPFDIMHDICLKREG